jgi:hypothetical protein
MFEDNCYQITLISHLLLEFRSVLSYPLLFFFFYKKEIILEINFPSFFLHQNITHEIFKVQHAIANPVHIPINIILFSTSTINIKFKSNM